MLVETMCTIPICVVLGVMMMWYAIILWKSVRIRVMILRIWLLQPFLICRGGYGEVCHWSRRRECSMMKESWLRRLWAKATQYVVSCNDQDFLMALPIFRKEVFIEIRMVIPFSTP